MTTSFFLEGLSKDAGYVNVRDSKSEMCVKARAFTELLWESYHPFADPNFQTDAKNHFLQRFWEMYLHCAFEENGLKPQRVGSEGPEFFFMHSGKKIWVEAIAPGPGTGDDAVPENPGDGQVRVMPTEKILLRFTQALRDKFVKYQKDRSKGIISPNDYVLLCINSRGIPDAPYGAELPYFIKAFLPLGNAQISINLKSGLASSAGHEYRNVIRKKIGSPVSTDSFLSPETSAFIGILHSSVDCANRPERLGRDFSVLHNPMSLEPFDEALFGWCEQFRVADDFIRISRPN
jgi:hypothetical protein